jgi:hypothetical protein
MYCSCGNLGVLHAFQALALDDQRESFHPSVWKVRPSKNSVTELVQCWFPGVHINVGGGSSSSAGEGDFTEQLASISYTWMLDLVRPYLAFDKVELEAQKTDWENATKDNMPDQVKEKQAVKDERNLFSKAWEWGLSFGNKEVKKQEHGYAVEEIEDSHGLLYDVMGKPKDRVPQNLSEEDIEKGWRTNESVHYTVIERQQKLKDLGRPDYVPHAMKGWVYDEKSKTWSLPGSKKAMPESQPGNGLPIEHSMENWLVEFGKGKVNQ